jgi:hypothetical protein
MPKASKSSAPETVEVEGYKGHLAELDGYTFAFEAYSADADMSPLFVGLHDTMAVVEQTMAAAG